MTNSNSGSPRRFLFKRLLQVLIKPGQVFDWVVSESGRLWFTPLLVLTVVTLVRVAISGWLQARAAMLGEIPLPPDWIYYTPDMQAQYMQAAQATSSPIFVYVLPAVLGLSAIWLGWLIVSSLLHLAFTLAGGRGTNSTSLNVVAWAGIPFSVREALRVIYLIIVRQPIASAGLSGFVTATEGSALFLSGLLALTDIFLIWHVILLIIGSKRTEAVSTSKSVLVTLIVILLVLAVQAGFSYLGGMMGGMMVTRPFYF